MPEKLLISACLLGQPVRYDGKSKPIKELTWLKQLEAQKRLFVVCPEMSGGLPVPRAPAELVSDRVVTEAGIDVTSAFRSGAEHALKICQDNQIELALLKAKSPSCGNKQIYDGSFSQTLVDGMGVTAKLLEQHGVQVFSELELDQLKSIISV